MRKTCWYGASVVAAAVLVMAFARLRPATPEITSVDRPPVSETNPYYPGNRAPLRPSSFIKLPIGSIRPQGWLLECLKRQRNGMAGRLEEVSPWLDKKDNAWLSPDGKGEHGWEELPYWLKGYGDMGYVLRDPAVIREARVWLDGTLASQRPDGYFGPVNMTGGKPDLWPNMVMLWCLQSYYDYSGDQRVLPFMGKYFRWELALPDSLFLQDYWEKSRGGDNLYSVYWLYNRTGEKWLLTLAEKIHRHTADWEQQGTLPNWHNVNIAQCFREPATYYLQTGDSSDLRSTYRDFELVRSLYGHVPGGMYGADENARKGYDDPHQGVETCGMVEQMNSDEMLLRFTGDPFWADNCENVTFNTYPAALMPDFKALRYFTAPNMVTSDATNHAPGIQNEGPFFMMNPLSNRCCQHNHAQGWPYYAENLWMATPDRGLAAVVYSASTVTAKAGNGMAATLTETTHYPFDETVRFTVHTAKPNRFPLYFRIPGWCRQATLTVNGHPAQASLAPDTYAQVINTWKDGDEVVLRLPMQLSVHTWKENRGSVSVNYGPLTFSLKIPVKIERADPLTTAVGDARWRADVDTTAWPAYDLYPAGPWNYGLLLDGQADTGNLKLVRKAWPKDDFPFTPDSAPWEIIAEGKKIPGWTLDAHGLCGALPQSPVAAATPEEKITLIPMGAARLRISAFPTVQ